ncbi:HipA N-terminal domain-containing protein [Pseudoflavitalea rhizosphaerae]|uniref:HipA N-terminal domain-containing protein n=1 Tax=Pseudoflavitalea rhizosphaerae TaxID=1884793 RepID=UPI000F8D2E9E|nr:HipA N-terminal domain-containing protein [Pseudoflavitalea rhizosphaerae]
MRSAQVFYNGKLAGIISKSRTGYQFVYDKDYLITEGSKPVSITLPLRKTPFHSHTLFPAFINRLSEGANKAMQNKLLKIDEQDYFSLLLATAGTESIGPITIKEIHEDTED